MALYDHGSRAANVYNRANDTLLLLLNTALVSLYVSVQQLHTDWLAFAIALFSECLIQLLLQNHLAIFSPLASLSSLVTSLHSFEKHAYKMSYLSHITQ